METDKATMVEFINRLKLESGLQSKKKAKIVKELEEKGRDNGGKMGLEAGEIQNIFDILEKEHPDL